MKQGNPPAGVFHMSRLALLVALLCAALFLVGQGVATGSHEDCSHGAAGSDIIGTNGSDVCNGTSVAEEMFANAGKDFFTGHDGWDDLHGDGGNDSMYESDGHGAAAGGTGHDRVHGNSGDDSIRDTSGGADEDHACDGRGNDDINIVDDDGNDTWFNYPDGQVEIDLDKDPLDNIADNRTDCPLPTNF